MFFIWDGNYKFSAWKNYINRVHTEDFERHVFVDSIILALQLDDIPKLVDCYAWNQQVMILPYLILNLINLMFFQIDQKILRF